MICSCAVWECQGTTHPEGAFRINVEGPAAGLPVSMAEDRHFTSLSGKNCTAESGRRVPVAGLWATAVPAAKIATPPIKVQPSRDVTAAAEPAKRSGVGLWQGRRRDPQDLVSRLLELDRLGFRFRQTGIADADLGLRGRVFCPDHVLAENIFCHARIIPTLTRPRDRNRTSRIVTAQASSPETPSHRQQTPSRPPRWR